MDGVGESLATKISLNMTYHRCGVSRVLFLLRCNVFTVLGEHSSACYRFPFLLLPSLRPPPLKPHEHYVACVCVTRQNSPRERAARSKVDSRILATTTALASLPACHGRFLHNLTFRFYTGCPVTTSCAFRLESPSILSTRFSLDKKQLMEDGETLLGYIFLELNFYSTLEYIRIGIVPIAA